MRQFYRKYGKRGLDLLIALPLFIIAFPFMLIIALVLKLTGHRKVLFIQERAGLNEKTFSLLKFRTMTEDRDEKGELLPDNKRLTKAGSFIRKTSMDELPQLINVIKGDMSLVGPRPLLTSYLPLYSNVQRKRHLVRPGISGWAQVNGRNALSWEKKFEYDTWYVEHLSLRLDLQIIMRTLEKILKAEGISQEGQATVKAFTGKNEA